MKRLFDSINRKTFIIGVIIVMGFLVSGVLLVIYEHLANSLEDQRATERWSKHQAVSQISCYFPVNSGMNIDTLYGFQKNLDQYMIQSSITTDSEHPDARLWASAYSAKSILSVSNDRTTQKVDAIGVGGDFFLFHPVQLIDGAYFSGQDVMQDYCLVDRETAWKMFGATDIVGKYLQIGNVPHKIVGVYVREANQIYETAGLSEPTIFVSYDSLSKFGNITEIENYEIVMPNPVKNFALHYVKEQLGDPDETIEILENSSRFRKLRILRLLSETDSRSMRTKPMVYPYWENVARGYENYLMIVLLSALIFSAIPMTLVVICVIIAWRRKTWTMREVFNVGKDKLADGFDTWKDKYRLKKEERAKERSWEDEF